MAVQCPLSAKGGYAVCSVSPSKAVAPVSLDLCLAAVTALEAIPRLCRSECYRLGADRAASLKPLAITMDLASPPSKGWETP